MIKRGEILSHFLTLKMFRDQTFNISVNFLLPENAQPSVKGNESEPNLYKLSFFRYGDISFVTLLQLWKMAQVVNGLSYIPYLRDKLSKHVHVLWALRAYLDIDYLLSFARRVGEFFIQSCALYKMCSGHKRAA